MPLSSVPRWLFVLKGVLAIAAVAALVHMAHPEAVAAALRGADLRFVAAALLLLPVNIGLEAYRWGRLVRRVAPEVRYREALRAVVGGYPMGLLTPGRIGDYVGRAVYLRAISPGVSAALTFGERMATLTACLVFGLAALGPYLAAVPSPSPLGPALLGVGGLGASALLLSVAFPSVARTALSAALPFAPVRRALQAFDRIPQDEALLLLVLSAVRYLVFSGQFVLYVLAFDSSAPVMGVCVAIGLVFFVKAVVPQVTLGDLGIRESAAVFFLGAYGVAPAAALDASLALFATNLLLPALAGVPFLFQLRLRPQPDAPVAGVPA